MKIALTTVMEDDGGVSNVVPFWRHYYCWSWHHPRDVPGENLGLGLLESDDDNIFDVVFPPWGIILEQLLTGGA